MSITQDVIDYVQSHPGSSSQEVIDGLPYDASVSTVQNTLSRLARLGVLQNRGGNINRFDSAKWYPNDPFISQRAQDLARDIYADMMKQHQSVREQFLAEQLDELLASLRKK